jgi:subfamily B ATP-binding cassette protein MsbA
MNARPLKQDPIKTKVLVRRLLKEFILPYKTKLLWAFLFMVLGALATSALPYSLKPVFDDVFIKAETGMLVAVCGLVLGAFIVKGASSYGESVLMTFVGQKIISDIQKKLFAHLMDADLAFFHNTPSGELLSRFTNDVTLMRNAMATTLIGLGKDALTLIFLVCLMFYMDPTLAGIAFIVFPTAILPLLKIGRRMRKVTHKTQDQHAVLTNQLTQIFQGIRVVKAYGMEHKESAYINTIIDNIFHLIYKTTRTRSASHPIVEGLGGCAIVAVIAYGGYQVMHHNRTAGDFMAFLASLLLVYEPLKRLSNLNANLQEGLAATARVFHMLDQQPTIVSAENDNPLTDKKGHIVFKDVSFQYSKDTGRKSSNKHSIDVLKNLSIEAKPGQTIALVGASGAGKSTIINLIPRFYDIMGGAITIDGIDIRDVSLADLRQQIALVSQEISLFDRSIADNIAYSEKAFSMDEIVDAAKRAAAHEFIEKLPDGYQTHVGENGVKLSGGQRQRIAIARAMLKDAPILLLDEATSALDTDSERQIQDALSRLMSGRTTILVAHRLSTVVDADWIYVLEKGQCVEQGRHDDLLIQNGVYAGLWQKQSSTQSDGK